MTRWVWSSAVVLSIAAVVGTRAAYHRPAPRVVGNGTCASANCHAGIEDPHPLNLRCVQCHGGNDQATAMEEAHVREPMSPLTNAPMTREDWAITGVLDSLPKDYVRFVNPGDLRVAATTCGESGCHADVVQRVQCSMHSTLSGYNALLVQFGLKSADQPDAFRAAFGIVPVRDPLQGKSAGRAGAVAQVDAFSALLTTNPSPKKSLLSRALFNGQLSENCVGCHVNAYGANNGKRRFRSSGCSACHFAYNDDGRSQSGDQTMQKLNEPRWGANGKPYNNRDRLYGHGRVAHPAKHEIHRVPDDQTCARCHVRGKRIMQNYQGFFHDNTRRAPRKTEADVHFQAGLSCMDCHTERDVHGDGAIYSREAEAVEVQCETCHGTLTQSAARRTRGGRLLANVFERPDGKIYLRRRKDHRLLAVPQIKDSLNPQSRKFNEAASIAHGRWDEDLRNGIGAKESTIKGFSHLDRVACSSCHSTWAHEGSARYAIDFNSRRRNLLNGEITLGVSTYRENFGWPDRFSLGLNPEGKVVPVVGQTIEVSSESLKLKSRLFSHNRDGTVRVFAPITPHTNQKKARDCLTCHPSQDGQNAGRVRLTLGMGRLTTDPRQSSGATKPLGVINADGYKPLDAKMLKRMLRVKVKRER